jgi:luciferase family oxidoreductase group 1
VHLKNIDISVLDLAPIRDGKSISETFHASLELAQHVEKLGYKRFWMAEHHNLEGIASSATSILLGFIAQGTKSIRVGSGGIMLPNHAPLVVAEQFGTLETLYPERIDLGLGRAPGTDAYTMRALRRNMERESDFAEQVQELQYFLAEPEPGQRLKAIPGKGLKIPLYILGSSLYSAHLAAALGLPYAFAGHFAPEAMLEAIKIYRNEFQASDTLKKPYVIVGVQAIVAETDAEANHLATTLFQRFLNLIRNERMALTPPVKSMDGLWSASEKAALDSKLRYAAIGGPEKVKADFTKLAELTGADEFIINSEPYDPLARLKSFELIEKVFKH